MDDRAIGLIGLMRRAGAIEIGESSAIRMYPYMPVYIFMDMKSGTRTIGVTIFHPHLLTPYHAGGRIKMNDNSRLFLFEPYL